MKELKEKHRFYLQGKTRRVLYAAIEYLESPVYLTQREAAKKHGCSVATLRERAHEICKLLNIDLFDRISSKPLPLEKRISSIARAKCSICGCPLGYPRYRVHFLKGPHEGFGKVVKHLCPNCFEKIFGGSL
jgi:hypothetical protein